MLKAVVVTSQLHFVPGNYSGFLGALAKCPQIHGMIVLNNLEAKYLLKASALFFAGATSTGSNLAKNYFRALIGNQKSVWESQGKKVWQFDHINDPAVTQLVKDQEVDLLVNARTRFIYKEAILKAPTYGCINIHHGLLPDQRGTMCDLWSLAEGREAGFSIHLMNQKIDDGGILGTFPVAAAGSEKSYEGYLQRSERVEAQAIKGVLASIEKQGQIPPTKTNVRLKNRPHYKNPTLWQIGQFRRQGLKL